MSKLESYDNLKQGEKGAWVSIGAYLFLSAVKMTIGIVQGSSALMADGLNNLTDIVLSIAVLIGLRISQKPPDEDHLYGHFRAETVASLFASFIMAAVGVEVVITAIRKLLAAEQPAPGMFSAWVALFCAVCMYAVYRYNRNLADRIGNKTLMAAALDNRSDAFVSIGAAVGIFGSQFGLPWMDPLAAGVVGLIILKTAWEIFRTASHALTDGFEKKELVVYKDTIRQTPGVLKIADMKARVHGSNVLLDVVVQVDPQLSVVESHEISDEIEKRMLKQHNIRDVHVHIEPLGVETGATVQEAKR